MLERAAEMIEVLDQPLLRGRHGVIIDPSFLAAASLATDLEAVLAAEGYSVGGGQIATAVILLPLQGVNKLVAFALDAATPDHIREWARTLDVRKEAKGGERRMASFDFSEPDLPPARHRVLRCATVLRMTRRSPRLLGWRRPEGAFRSPPTGLGRTRPGRPDTSGNGARETGQIMCHESGQIICYRHRTTGLTRRAALRRMQAILSPPDLPERAPAGLFLLEPSMAQEPPTKHAVCFIDGQNLFRHAKAAFGHYDPNYDPIKLSEAVCARSGWVCTGTRFYTGVPVREHDERWHGYWHRRLAAMRRAGVHVTSRRLRYTREVVTHPDGSMEELLVPREKGIDLRLGLDVVRMARGGQFDVAVIFSQDQDLAEVAREIREIARSTGRWLKIASAYPVGPTSSYRKGIYSTDWLRIDQTLYDACLDLRDYRPANWWPSTEARIRELDAS